MNKELQNSESSNSSESFPFLVAQFEKNLKVYHDLVNKEKDIFKTVKNSEKEFMEIVGVLVISAKEINRRIKDPEENTEMSPDRLNHYKLIFNHYDTFFDIQKKTAETYLVLKKNKQERKIPNIVSLREKFTQEKVLATQLPKI